jgi:two-component system OmpR family response regulator
MIHRVWRGDQEIDLSAKEFLMLATLMRHPGRAMTRQQLLDHAWDSEYEAHSNVVDVYIGYLRDKVDRPFERRNIETVRGVGYRLVARTDEANGEPAMTDLE